MMILPSPSHQNPSLILGFLIFANFRRPAIVYDLHLVQGSFLLFLSSRSQVGSGCSVLRIHCTLYTASITLSHPLLLYYPKIRGFRVPSCCGLGGFCNYPMCSLMKDSMINGFRLLNNSAPVPANYRGNYGYLLTKTALWRLFPSSKSGKKNDDNSGCILLEVTGSYECMCTGYGLVRWLLPSLLAILLFKLSQLYLIIIKIMNTLLCSTQYSSSDRLLSITHSLGLKIVRFIFFMKIISWNVQGAKKAQALEEVKILKCTG
ncbi:hypothetical protein Cgig2_008470 [Carnegiea gigantea]|uniref:Uncharacterized protein n=1 Tax=Carnegiea gigantea TaxID=171969 RepID=A0A9Q1JUJ2_9CARY|nr:hypothetical protein Cgig2_008470 [Carnegiea gigantea]